MLNDYPFAVCLTHDVDRPYKTFQAPYYALKERNPSHLRSLVSSVNPYWQFEEIMDLEDEFGVRSTFFFLNEQQLFSDKGLRYWMRPKNWKLYTGRYNINADPIREIITKLDDDGWEIGLHGSYESYRNIDLLRTEKEQLESILGHSVDGIRQHYLNLERPRTWTYHRKLGFSYDASLGSKQTVGFEYGFRPFRPFDDEFVVFPLTMMEIGIMQDRSLQESKNRCDKLFREAEDNTAVLTVLWHPRFFDEDDFPGFKDLYIHLIERSLEMGAWIGDCRSLYRMMNLNEP